MSNSKEDLDWWNSLSISDRNYLWVVIYDQTDDIEYIYNMEKWKKEHIGTN